MWEKEGAFSIRSACNIISDGGACHSLHDHIWRPKSPLKGKLLAWRISHGSLQTRDRLSHFLPDIQPTCVLCGEDDETLDHLFADCSYSWGCEGKLLGGPTAGVDFDDRNSWMFLFKDYWLDLKRKLSLTLEEILKAKNPWKGPLAQNEESSDELYDAKDDLGSSSDSSSVRREGNKPARKKARRRSKTTAGDVEPVKLLNIESTSLPEDSEWASEELLEFVSHMRGGDKSVMCQFDVHTLLLEYIKQNNLRDPRKKSQIICDSRLEKLFAKARVGHFEMLKLLESHFLLKETSQAVTDDNQGGVVDPEFGQMDTEGNSEVVPRTGSEKKRKSRKKTEEREPQNNLDDYAAIDIHNISLIYLRRNLMEELLDDTENFSEKVLGSFVRIRISGAGQRQDMYRLVQVIGTGKAGEKYKTGKRTTDITLEILNLDKTEVICIDTISNQEFTERDVLEKAMALQAVRVNEASIMLYIYSLENEKMRLSHLRDRASEKGRRKEYPSSVYLQWFRHLQLLNSPEERSRRLTDVPEIHADPNMDPNYESAEEESGDKRQDNFVRSTDSRFSRMGRELNPSPKGNMGSTDSWSGSRRGSASWESSKNLSTRGAWERVDTSSVPIDKVNEVTLNQVKDLYLANSWDPSKSLATAGVTETGIRGNGPDGTKSRQAQSLSSETVSTTQRDETAVQSNINENEKMWHYQDPSAKVQGPFSMTQLRKWNTTGYFPANLRIWRASEKQEESILLSDALVGKFRKEPPPPKMQNNTSTHLAKVSPAVVAREGNTTGNWRGNNESWVEKRKDEVGSSSGVWEPSKDANAWSSQPKVHAVPPPSVVPLSTNLDQASAHQARDRSGSNGRWKGGPSHGNSWGSHGPAAFHPSGHGYERQHSGFVYPGHQSPGEHLKGQAASSSNQWVNDSFNLPTPPPRPGGGWMGSQSIGNQPSASLNIAVQPAVSGWAGTAVGGGNSLQFPSVAINEASKVSAYVQQPPSAAGTLASWGSSTSLLKPTEMAANWNSSSTAPIAMVKESVLSDSLAGAHAPSLQNGPSATDRQTSSAQSPFNNDLTVTSCNFQKNMHMKDDCPSPTPKDEQAKFDALISETNQQSNIYVDPGKSLSPIRSVDSIQYPASAAASASMQMLNVLSVDQVNQSSQPASSTTNLPSNNEMSSTKSPSGLDDLGSLSYQKQIDVPSDPKYSSPSQEKASDFSQRKETESLVAKLPSEGDGLEQTPHTQNLQIFDPAKSGHLVLPAVRTDWSMPSPTPMIEPSVSHGGTDSALGVSTSSTQWNSSMQMQGTGNNEIRHHGVGISQENMNRGVEPGKESGHINHGVQGTTNAGLGAVMPANAGSVWANPPQANTNVNVGWCPPQQGNANMNMFWVALAQANPGWGSQLQANPNPNPNPNPGWVLTAPANTAAVSSWGTVAQPGNPNPNQVWGPATQSNANATSGWAVPQSNANPNAGWFGQGNVNVGSNASGANPGSWGAQLKQNADGYPAHSDRGFQNNDAGHGGGRHGWNRSQNSGGGGPSRGPPPRGQMAGICKYHESGHCKKGAHCNFLHT
ncbi:hypothetical protein Taro_026667 [Colocasia esculenta]|uniref:Zinc finger CCCH domain-containing protein 19 n=1 Tax=Colocasia esculenta TaxID=4460 RepID=A0A843VRZ5_COLES|nr:hypothetical protein [Colocasia esculenta]